MKENYPEIFNDWLNCFLDKGEAQWSDRTDYFWSILDEKAEAGEWDENELDPLDKSDIYFLDQAYNSDYIYGLIIEACRKMAT